MITIFTPTYNRAHTIPRLYESLRNLNNKDFEWLVVDDGSVDETEMLIKQYMAEENAFPIRYIKTPNGGKHRAINRGVELANGELFFIVDSDDWLPEESLNHILHYFYQIKEKPTFIGVAGAKSILGESVHGGHLRSEYIDATCEECFKYHILGERAHVFKTDILKKYPFPEYEDEKFVTEGVIYTAMSRDGFKLRWFDISIYSFEYQRTGITNNLENFYKNSPRGYLHYMSLIISCPYHPAWRKFIYKGKCISLIKDSSIDKIKIRRDLQLSRLGYYLSQAAFKIHRLMRGGKQ